MKATMLRCLPSGKGPIIHPLVVSLGKFYWKPKRSKGKPTACPVLAGGSLYHTCFHAQDVMPSTGISRYGSWRYGGYNYLYKGCMPRYNLSLVAYKHSHLQTSIPECCFKVPIGKMVGNRFVFSSPLFSCTNRPSELLNHPIRRRPRHLCLSLLEDANLFVG